jgi:signal transduction histidine kinase
MIMWGFAALICALVASGLLLRRVPLLALAVTLAGSAAISMEPRPGLPPSAQQVLIACAAGIEVCYMAATRTRKVSVTGVAAASAGLVTLILEVPPLSAPFPNHGTGGTVGGTVPTVTIAVPLVMIIAWLIGNSIRQAHARAELLRAQAAAQTALAERLRIARELHDIVAHSIGIIAIQAGSGRSVYDASPAEARDALAAIEATSRETLSGLRRMMAGLRRAEPGSEPGSGPKSGPGPLSPVPGLADLDRLVAMTQDAGVRVDVEWHGGREPLPADIDLSAFRIIQEAVTNVVRHAGTSQCQVSISQQDGQLSIEVTDHGRGGSTAGTGYGITGMRERAALLGGDFSAGAGSGGGFRVTVRLPLPAPAR